MGKAYTQVSNEARKELIRLIHEEGMSIVKAAEVTGVYYPTAKAINKVYKNENRVQKRSFRYRTKKDDLEQGVVRNKIPVERLTVP
jgi:transposase